MALIIRKGTPSDIDGIVEVFKNKEHFYSIAWSSHLEAAKRFIIQNLTEKMSPGQKDLNFLPLVAARTDDGKIIGYLLLYNNITETITGEKQVLIFDYGITHGHNEREILASLLEKVEETARESRIKYIIHEIFIDDIKGMELFENFEFKREMNRIIKEVALQKITTRQPDPFIVRKAEQEDLMFILWLNTQCGSFTIPEGREGKREDIQFRFLHIYSGMSLTETEDFAGLIIEDTIKDEPGGYLLLKTDACDTITGERLGYVYDISIHPDYWGKRATQRLMKEGENYLFNRGIHYFLGDICEDNQRALKTAIKSVGFNLESIRWVKKLPEC